MLRGIAHLAGPSIVTPFGKLAASSFGLSPVGEGVAEAATSYRVHGRKAKQLATVLRIPKADRREIAALVDQLAE